MCAFTISRIRDESYNKAAKAAIRHAEGAETPSADCPSFYNVVSFFDQKSLQNGVFWRVFLLLL